MIGDSVAFRAVGLFIERMSSFDVPVLIEGETGTGKELAAHAIHSRSARRGGPFIPVNCGAIPDSLLESELFGHRRGAFTDARFDQLGLVEQACHGTLFLDEVDALTPKGQVALLRFLQDQHFRPLGAQREQKADVRVITASNRSLEGQVAAGEFRVDLLYRLNVMRLALPPLRERHGDPTLLARHFSTTASVRFNKPALEIDGSTLAWFERYQWPGNIRELENLVNRAFLLADGERIVISPPAHLVSPHGRKAIGTFHEAKNHAIAEFESRFLSQLMGEANGNVSVAARMSGTERRHLGRLLKKYRIAKQPSNAA
jgi:DNA-binding NtrC family response regulator